MLFGAPAQAASSPDGGLQPHLQNGACELSSIGANIKKEAGMGTSDYVPNNTVLNFLLGLAPWLFLLAMVALAVLVVAFAVWVAWYMYRIRRELVRIRLAVKDLAGHNDKVHQLGARAQSAQRQTGPPP